MEKPLVSVIITSFNRFDMLKEAINSVLNQTYTNYEIIVVDDASTDNSPIAIKQEYGNKINFVSNERNLGPVQSRNRGIDLSNGEYIALLDSDDVFLPNKLEYLVNVLNKAPGTIFVYCGWEWYDFEEKKLRLQHVPDATGLINSKERWTYNILPDLVKSSYFKKNKFNPNVKSYELYEVLIKLEATGRIAFTPYVLSRFRDHSGPRNSKSKAERIESISYLTKEHGEFMLSRDKTFYAKLLQVKILYSLELGMNINREDYKELLKLNPINLKFYLSCIKRKVLS